MTSVNRTNGICLKHDEHTCFYLEDPSLIGWHDTSLLLVWILVFWCFNVAMVSPRKKENQRQEKVSLALSTLLELIRISSFHTQLAAFQMYFEEHFTKTCFNKIIFRCGGKAEGLFLPESDEDHMLVDSNIVVGMNSQSKRGSFIIADTSECRPGYTKLVITNFMLIFTNLFDGLVKIVNVLYRAENGILYLGSEKLKQCILTAHKGVFQELHQHGPSLALEIPDNFGFLTGVKQENALKDNCFAIELDSWPAESKEWFIRIRRHEWPSRSLIEEIRKMPCHVVPVGDSFSPKCFLEWRISFILAERELLRKFNNTQIQCYALLKNIFKRYIYNTCMEDFKNDEKEELSSYSIKTILFWESENNPFHIWQPNNLIKCVEKCLLSLKEAVKDSKLEHYFYRRNNLLHGKLRKRSTKQSIVRNINKVLNNLMSNVIRCAYAEGLDMKFWCQCEKSGLGLPTFALFFAHGICSPFFNKLSFSKQYTKHSMMLAVYCRIVQSDRKLTDTYRSLLTHKNFPYSLDKHLMQLLYKFVNIRWAFQNYRQDHDDKFKCNREILTILQNNADIDGISGKLYLATFWLAVGNYEKMDIILKSIMPLISSKTLIYVGFCTKARGYVLTEDEPEFIMTPKWNSWRTFVYSVAFDIFLSQNDIPILPREIKLEVESMSLTLHVQHKFVIIHPLVYTYYLAFENARYKNDKSELSIYLKRLQRTVDSIDQGVQIHRALNILGHCYSVAGETEKARECFEKSLETTNWLLGEPNAAYQYLRNLPAQSQEQVVSEQMSNQTRGFLPERIVLVLQALVLLSVGVVPTWFTVLLIASVAAETFLNEGGQDGSRTNGVIWFCLIIQTVTVLPKIALVMSIHVLARRITAQWVWLLRSIETGFTVTAIGYLIKANFMTLIWIFILVQVYIFFSIISFKYASDICDGFITSATMFVLLIWYLYYFSFPFTSAVVMGIFVLVMDIYTIILSFGLLS